MGASQGFVLRQTLVQLVCVAVLVTMLGTVVGYVAQAGLAWLLRDLIRSDLPPPGLSTAWVGLVTAVTILVGFALPPLLQLKRVPPARVLRRNLEPPPLRYAAVYLFAIGAVLALLYWLVRDARLVTVVAAGIGGTFLALAARRLVAGEGAGAAAQRRRRRLALRARQHRAPRPRQRGADRRVRARHHGAAAAGAGAQRPARGLARQPAGRRAQLLHDQHPPGRGRGDRRVLPQSGACRPPSWCRWCGRGSRRSTTCRSGSITFQGDRAQGFAEREANLTWARTLRDDNRLRERPAGGATATAAARASPSSRTMPSASA